MPIRWVNFYESMALSSCDCRVQWGRVARVCRMGINVPFPKPSLLNEPRFSVKTDGRLDLLFTTLNVNLEKIKLLPTPE